jgi:hypothetical protein
LHDVKADSTVIFDDTPSATIGAEYRNLHQG